MTALPSSSIAGASGLVRGRELTAEEERAFQRKQRPARAGMVVVLFTVPILVGLLAWGATHPDVDLRVRTYPNGVKHMKAEYVGALRHGRFVEYHRNERKKAEGAYRDGLRTGTWRYYDENGDLVYLEGYQEGQLLERVAPDEEGR